MNWIMRTRDNGMATSRHPPSTLATPAACAARPSSTHTAAYGSSTTSSAAVPSASSQTTHPSAKSSPKSAPKHGAASTQRPGRERDHRRQRAQRRPSQPLPAIPRPLARLRPTRRRHPRPPRHRSRQHPHRPARRHAHGTVPRQDRVSPLPDACAAITTGDIHTAGMLSGGAGSWGACRRWIDQHGTDGLVLLFTDVGGNPANAHTGEDPDTLRFLDDAAADLGAPLVKLRDGRDIWDVFWQKRWLGNTQVAHCSWELKTTPVRQWLEQNAPRVQRIIVGIDATEDHRAAG